MSDNLYKRLRTEEKKRQQDLAADEQRRRQRLEQLVDPNQGHDELNLRFGVVTGDNHEEGGNQ